MPQKTPFYLCIADHFEEFVQVYEERYEQHYGLWRPGTFHPLPWIDTQKMALLFMNKVFTMLIAEEKISEGLAQKVASWPRNLWQPQVHGPPMIEENNIPSPASPPVNFYLNICIDKN